MDRMSGGEMAVWFAFGAVIYASCYFVLRTYVGRELAHVWLCLGGMVGGALLSFVVTFYAIFYSVHGGWTRFGIGLWYMPFSLIGGAILGFWAVVRWSRPRETNQAPEESSRTLLGPRLRGRAR